MVAGDPHDMRQLLFPEGEDGFLLRNNGEHVPVSELEGKIIGLYFTLSSFRSCHQFTPVLTEAYSQLKEQGERFEVVAISLHDDEESFRNDFRNMPWLALPFNEKTSLEIATQFDLSAIPTLVVIGSDGKTLHGNARRYVNVYGVQAYPFSPERLAELDETEKKRQESLTLESILVHDGIDFVQGKTGVKVPVSELTGKIVLFYFSRQACPPCRQFTPKLAKVYNEIRAKHDDFEVVFVSLDNEEKSYEDYYSCMPWLTLPYGDKREWVLRDVFDFSGIPYLGAIGPNGKVLTDEAKELVMFFGSDAYPFDKNRVDEMEREMEKTAKNWPEKASHVLHPQHELVRSRAGIYICAGCSELVQGWVYECSDCNYALHPGCALNDKDHGDQDDARTEASNDGWVCDGSVCRRV